VTEDVHLPVPVLVKERALSDRSSLKAKFDLPSRNLALPLPLLSVIENNYILCLSSKLPDQLGRLPSRQL